MNTTHPDTPEDRPTWACALHRPPADGQDWVPADRGYATCSNCLDRLRAVMRDIGDRYRMLDPTPQKGATGRGAPGFGSRSPASDHVIAFTDPRSSQTAKVWVDRAGRACREDERPPVSIRGELDILAWDAADRLGLAGPHHRADVHDLLRHLDQRLDLITRDPDLVVEVAFKLRALQAALRPVTGDPRPKFIGLCPELLPEPDEAGVPLVCSARLYAPIKDSSVNCRSCGAHWPRERWLELGRSLQVAPAA
ncbi:MULTISPECIES: hypothetical protein [Pseudonocardia]|uniref:Uncharacterized protein n=2 Tax=Pseudonocardia TaxID=1847 RepID=A0A1Y2N7T0_PSEAH|nr:MULTISPECIES: hypothetical protein [Pseudonocardia]OSY42968.1 hypothetical protein BG845_01210 [Pseudonocardia autotrophica]TDN77544.1 hypothetical protein C8E95_6792 [Pseudonocardia autotrophica]BBG01572.1 hypothetical protein Pdca_27810 [Pseudonocardia autotrophica]GEC29079.1 hypothetical protein PSA01_61080 [Pseudonocardia saturnea]